MRRRFTRCMTILILGGAGRTEARIHHRLNTRGVPTPPASRQAGFDWNQPETWSHALRGISAAYVCFSSDLAFPGVVVDVPTLVADLATDGIPAEKAVPLGHLFTKILDGRTASLGDGVEQLLGEPASSFCSYAQAAAKTGVWA